MRSFRDLAIVLWAGLLWGHAASAGELRLVSVAADQPAVERLARCELTIQITGAVKNPYDPAEIAVEATFQPPRGAPMTVPAFYYQPFERVADGRHHEELRPVGTPVWKARCTPDRVGRWSYTVRLTTPSTTQAAVGGTFEVTPSQRRGFVRLNRHSGQFQFEDGHTFIPIGENLAWGPSAHPLPAYDEWFQALTRQHANYIRVWMASWSFRLETKETGVGTYDQARAWQLDYLLDRSAAAGLYWQLCLLDHGAFSQSQDPDWQNNPYNDKLGGMCRLPNDFVTDPRAKARFRQLLRYLVARWGSSPQLVSWELFNEANYSDINANDLTPWIKEMSEWLHRTDVQDRPVTISFHKTPSEAVWRLPSIDTIQWHEYDQVDFPGLFLGPTIPAWQQAFHKPVMIGEFGWITEFVRQIDKDGIHLHDGLWSSLMSGAAGGALIWYWDTYVHPNRLERHFQPVARFWEGERLGEPLRRVAVTVSDPGLLGGGCGTSGRTYLWIKNRAHNLSEYLAYRCALAKERLCQARGQSSPPAPYPPRIVRGATATVSGLDWIGRYRIEWWDTYRGRLMAASVGEVRWGALTVPVPELAFDVAAKLVKLHWWERG